MTTSWQAVRAGLKPFQIATVDAAFDGLWNESTTSRFLVADEVGLGKTLVAKGVIARTIEHLRSLGERRIDIVYICSNQSIARQNLLKLKEFADGHEESAERLTKLVGAKGLRTDGVNVVSLTPGTSFSFGHRSGTFSERALLYAAVQLVWPQGFDVLRRAGGKRIFYDGIRADDRLAARARLDTSAREWMDRISDPAARAIRETFRAAQTVRKEQGRPSIWDEIRQLEPGYGRRSGPTWGEWEQRQTLIGELRQLLAAAGVKLLRPDLVIMDEFQRFADLLDPRSADKAAQLLRTFVTGEHAGNAAPTKVLLLSATPYRWFDRSGQGTHYSDFLSTLRFLHDGDDDPVGRVEHVLQDLRSAVRLGAPGREAAELAARAASEELRQVMVRTERLSSTPDRNGMLIEQRVTVPVTSADVEAYVAAERRALQLDSPNLVELWKTAPWIFNIGDGYQVTSRLHEQLGRRRQAFAWSDPGSLDIDAVARFEPLDMPNPRLRWLRDRTVGRDWHRLVWLPASRPYYRTDNDFDRAAEADITKHLVFSSWRIAPKAIAIGLTYAAEQRIYGPQPSAAEGTGWASTPYRSQERRLLDLSVTDGRADSPTSFLPFVPFAGLADLVDPLSLGRGEDGQLRSVDEVRADAEAIISRAVARGIGPARAAGASDVRWFVHAARMLSRRDDAWWRSVKPSTFTSDDDDRQIGLKAHIESFAEAPRPDARPPQDLVAVLVDLALGSPAICALRSLRRVLEVDDSGQDQLLDAASRIGWSFRSLYDTPEITRVVEGDRPYWHALLDYGIQGNLQAVMDEYIHMLREWKVGGRRTLDAAAEIATAAHDALTFRTVTLTAHVPGDGDTSVESRQLRSRFAVRFGDRATDEDGDRKDVTGAAFNSPFWPFVMATTSIGQEGLDFHLYSHVLVHWNLPLDPVALEQREGRVHRFKGHAVRKNVAAKWSHVTPAAADTDVWDAMFEAAADPEESDGITPYWIYEGDARIERLVPMLSMAREHGALERLKQGAATYRMAFGQPRHDDLLEIVDGDASVPTIDLSPPRRMSS